MILLDSGTFEKDPDSGHFGVVAEFLSADFVSEDPFFEIREFFVGHLVLAFDFLDRSMKRFLAFI